MESKCNTIEIEIMGYFNKDEYSGALTKTRKLTKIKILFLSIVWLISYTMLMCWLLTS